MQMNDERKHDDRRRASDPRLHDPPKPVVRVDDRSEIAQKLARLTEGLAATPETASADKAPAAPPPSIITSSSLDEARAYISCVSPAFHEEPVTLEMQRVRVADEVNSVTWITERVERRGATAGHAAPLGQAPHNEPGEADADAPFEPVPRDDPEAARWLRRRARTKAAAAGGLTLALAALGAAYLLLIGRPTSAQGKSQAQPAIQGVISALEPLKDRISEERPGEERHSEPSTQPTRSPSSLPSALTEGLKINPPPRPPTVNRISPPHFERGSSAPKPSATAPRQTPPSSVTSSTSSAARERAPELIEEEPEP